MAHRLKVGIGKGSETTEHMRKLNPYIGERVEVRYYDSDLNFRVECGTLVAVDRVAVDIEGPGGKNYIPFDGALFVDYHRDGGVATIHLDGAEIFRNMPVQRRNEMRTRRYLVSFDDMRN